MNKTVKEKFWKAERGKEIFKRLFDLDKLSIDDAFVLVITNSEEWIYYGLKYLYDFIEQHHKRNVYILLSSKQYADSFSKSGGIVKICTSYEMESLAAYLKMFQENDLPETRMVFLTPKDRYGLSAKELLGKGEFTLEEYIAVSLYQLKGLKGEA